MRVSARRATATVIAASWIASLVPLTTGSRPCVMALDKLDAQAQGCEPDSIADVSGHAAEGRWACCPDDGAQTLLLSRPRPDAVAAPKCSCSEGSTASFRCDDTKLLRLDQVNDDYCDCDDGSDEVGTSACSHSSKETSLFWCANDGFEPRAIPDSRVRDGICDCCDGSDEMVASNSKNRLANAPCSNTCATLQAEKVKQRTASLQLVAQGRRAADALLEEQSNSRDDASKRAEILRKLASSLESTLKARVKAVWDVEEQKQRRVFREKQLGWARRQSRRWRLQGQRAIGPESATDHEGAGSDDPERHMSASAVAGHANENADEEEMEMENENKNDDLEDNLAKIRNNIETAAGIKEALQLLNVTYWSEKALAKSLTTLSPVRIWFVQNGVYDLWLRFWDAGPTMYFYFWQGSSFRDDMIKSSPQLSRLKQVDDKINDLIARCRALATRALGPSAGPIDTSAWPDPKFAALEGRCLSQNLMGYKYSLCLFKSAKQGTTSLGKFKGWSSSSGPVCVEDPVTGEMPLQGCASLSFADGAKCWNGPKRSVDVRFRCGIENEIISVDEPSTCAYAIVVETPFACEHIQII
ncbi:Glucosidase 2 subunit beta [Hondaea fermentalgiana]|uniref:Glucosidase 2 subunit beta n=1 Tax=Hondaea fermentalgiana TaxID=2315210 RepID=A0A2R5GW61_9STRA|nr:Glucosidase 2 subunit beta [Hondaea fermentalgiana]|eukprot:GBG34569.1 Glucosidase 2 subunit beta [Hondaea fermentalgiana]